MKLRGKVIDKFLSCFMIDELLKKFNIQDSTEHAEAKAKLFKLQETSYTSIIETLCVVSSDRFTRVPILYYQPPTELLTSLETYLIALDSSEADDGQKLYNSSSKRLVEGLKKSKFLLQDEGSEKSDDEEEKENAEEDEDANKAQTTPKKHDNEDAKGKTPKKKVTGQKESQKIDERLHFSYSLLIKLLMQSSRLLMMDFGTTLMVHLLRSPYEKIETLTQVLFKKLKSQEIDGAEGLNRTNYWRSIDGILLRLYQEGDLRKACDVARMASKLYFEKTDKMEERKKIQVGEKYLKYLVNCILFATSNSKYYDFLSVVSILMNKNYLDKDNYKKLLAFFEVSKVLWARY